MKIHWPNYRSYFSNIVEIQEDWMKKSSGFKTKYKKIDKEIMDLHNSLVSLFWEILKIFLRMKNNDMKIKKCDFNSIIDMTDGWHEIFLNENTFNIHRDFNLLTTEINDIDNFVDSTIRTRDVHMKNIYFL